MRWLGNTFLYWVLPIILTIVLAGLFLQFVLGYNVVGTIETRVLHMPLKANSGTVKSRSTLSAAVQPTANGQLAQLRARLRSSNAALQAANKELRAEKTQATQYKAQWVAAKKQVAAMTHMQSTAAGQASVYMNMSSSQAVLIILKLPFLQQVDVLKAMDPATQASILGAMAPAVAAKLLQAGA